MTERLGPEPEPIDYLETIERRVIDAREMTAAPYQLGTVTVAYDSDDWVYGSVWVRGNCSGCPAVMVQRASHPSHLRQLAIATAAYECPKFGHEQDIDGLIKQSSPEE